MLRHFRELYLYRGLLWSLTLRELKARYRASVLGFLWTFLNPTLQMLVYALLFRVYMRQDIPHYLYFVFVGLLPWIWFASSVGGGVGAISERRDLLTKVRFPAQVLPATVVATHLANYAFSLPLMMLLGAFYGVWPTPHLLLFPVVLALQLLFTLALSYLLSALNVLFRDLQHIVGNLLTLWFFVTPIPYALNSIPERYQKLVLHLNPMAAIVTSYQDIWYHHRIPQPQPLLIVAGASVALLWLSTAIFDARREEFAELV